MKPTDSWTEKQWQEFAAWLYDLLLENEVKVTFKKKDGTIRIMRCTLDSKVIPRYERKTDREKKPNELNISVFDLERKAWRSFVVKNITSVEFVLG